MKRYFSTGLAILLPIIFTAIILGFLINFFTCPFLGPTKQFISNLISFHHPYLLSNEKTLITLISKGVILLFLFGFTLLIGFLGQLFLIDAIFSLGNYFLHRVPIINRIYKACQDVVKTFFTTSKAFSQVVLVPFPDKHSLSIGLVTGDSIKIENSSIESDQFISVFVPGTPNPSVGFLLILKKEQLIYLNMKVDDAMKFIISCGVIPSNFTVIQPVNQT